jgi:hypothetical protein
MNITINNSNVTINNITLPAQSAPLMSDEMNSLVNNAVSDIMRIQREILSKFENTMCLDLEDAEIEMQSTFLKEEDKTKIQRAMCSKRYWNDVIQSELAKITNKRAKK